LPSQEDTLLLRACITPGESGKRACEAWLKQNQNGFQKEAIKAFLPLLLHAVRNHSISVDAAFLTVLRTAALREELRTNTYNGICGSVISALADNGIPSVVLAGAALAGTVYSNPALRHSHDVDILIPNGEITRATALLLSLRIEAANLFQRGSQPWEFKHRSGLPLRLHSELFQMPCDGPPTAEIWSRSPTLLIAGVPMRALSPADSLFYVCGHAAYSRTRQSLRWVSDAWLIADRHPDLDWELVLDCAVRARLALPLSVMLGYLSKELEAPIPPSFLQRLRALASRVDTTSEAAVYAAIVTSSGLGRSIRLVRNWRQRVLFIVWMLFPSPSYFIEVWKIRNISLLPFYYVYRTLRYATCRLSSIIKVLIQRAAEFVLLSFVR